MDYHLFQPGKELFKVIGEYLHSYEVDVITAYWHTQPIAIIHYSLRKCMEDFWEDGLSYILSLNYDTAKIVWCAILENRPDVLMKCVTLGWDHYNSGLQLAATEGNIAMMKLCKRLGADADVAICYRGRTC